jgi:hypothetical protein
MKSIRETCIDFFKSEDIKRDVKQMVQPIVGIIYNEIYPYIWLICFYHVFLILLIFIVLANLIILLRSIRMVSWTHTPMISQA